MFYFSSARRHLRGTFTQKTLVLIVVSCLFTALLFTGCQPDADEFVDDHKLNQKLIGTWSFVGEWGTDGYTINAAALSYSDAFGFDYDGSIEYVSNFSETAGVIIIKYTRVGDGLESTTVGKFNGVYYQKLKSGTSVEMSSAWANGDEIKNSLNDAKAAFTKGNRGDYVSVWGGPYLKK